MILIVGLIVFLLTLTVTVTLLLSTGSVFGLGPDRLRVIAAVLAIVGISLFIVGILAGTRSRRRP